MISRLLSGFTVVAVLAGLTMMVSCKGSGSGKVEFKTDMDKVSYCIGTDIGKNLKENKIELNVEIFAQAIKDVFDSTKTPALSDSEMANVMQKFQEEFRAKAESEHQKMISENKSVAAKFLAENAKKTGVNTLPDSLQYEVITEGKGPMPKATDRVKVNYAGTLIDGTEFDSSYKRGQPVEFGVTGVIPGWTEILQLMKVGSKYKVYVPPQLAYGENGTGRIPPNSLLIFEIELLEIVKNK